MPQPKTCLPALAGLLLAIALCLGGCASAPGSAVPSRYIGKDAAVQYEAGKCYLSGKGVKQNLETARKLLELAANKGHDGAQAMLGKMYDDDKDCARAKDWYEIAAATGNSSALNNLGMM